MYRTHPANAPLPFFLRLILFYLLTDALVRLGGLGWRCLGHEGWKLNWSESWNLLLGAFYLLLIPQILVRSIAARISLSLVFVVQICQFVTHYALGSPSEWWAASDLFRIQQLAQLIFFTTSIVLLNHRPSTDVLRY